MIDVRLERKTERPAPDWLLQKVGQKVRIDCVLGFPSLGQYANI